MDFGDLRRLALTVNGEAHGVPAVVRRPHPHNGTTVATTLIWMTPDPQQAPNGSGRLSRQEPRRIAVIPRDEVPQLEHKTRITAAEFQGGETKAWIVDGYERLEADQHRVYVIEDPQWCSE